MLSICMPVYANNIGNKGKNAKAPVTGIDGKNVLAIMITMFAGVALFGIVKNVKNTTNME